MVALAVGAVLMIAGWPYAVEASRAQPISARKGTPWRRSHTSANPLPRLGRRRTLRSEER
jgi:hypothetical protein